MVPGIHVRHDCFARDLNVSDGTHLAERLRRHPPNMTVIRRPCGPATPGRAMLAALQLPSVRFGKSVRIPRLAYERYLKRLEGGHPEPLKHDSSDSQDQREDFRDATGHDPETWIDGWRSGSIPDTLENTRLAIHALGLRDAPRRRTTQAGTSL